MRPSSGLPRVLAEEGRPGMKCPRCQQENRSPVNFCSRCGESLGVTVGPGLSYAQLRAENEALMHSLGAASEQQTATAEILRVISSSPTDVQPVFDAIVRRAVRLCDGLYGFVGRFDGEQIHIAAHHNYTPDALRVMQAMYPMRPSRQQMSGRVILSRSVIQIEDLLEDPEYAQHLARAGGWRASLGVPLLREGNAIGMIAVMRGQPGPFSETQVELLKTFANQAVIAIENVRLFNETKEALEQQTATSEILRVISRSPTDLQPVFDAMLESAVRLLGGFGGAILRYDEGLIHFAAVRGGRPQSGAEDWFRSIFPLQLDPATPVGRAILERRIIQVSDTEDTASEITREVARQFQFRAVVSVPMLRKDAAIGVISVTRAAPGKFSDPQIVLLKTFADQAVIAIENVRLFKELQTKNQDLSTSLDQQTGTSEILRVISSSPTDIQPVFDAVAESAARLCEAFDAAIFRREGESLCLAAHHGPIAIQTTLPLVRGTSNGRAVLDGRTVHVADMQTEAEEFPEGSQNARRMGHRTVLAVPLMRHGTAIGTIIVRRTEAHLFTERQVALLQTFADQAVIAIENVRLFNELESRNRDLTEALDRQTATAEVLRV